MLFFLECSPVLGSRTWGNTLLLFVFVPVPGLRFKMIFSQVHIHIMFICMSSNTCTHAVFSGVFLRPRFQDLGEHLLFYLYFSELEL